MNSYQISQIIFNIIGGILASIIFFAILSICRFIKKKYIKRSFKQIFGYDAVNSFYLVYGKMILLRGYNEEGKLIEWPYAKLGTQNKFRITSPVSFTETKSAKYLSESFSKFIEHAPNLISDEEIKDKLDISYCSMGGYNNFKSIDVLDSSENTFLKIENDYILAIESPEQRYQVDGEYDYAVIIKIIPKSFPNRVWIAVVGLGEWGTSGASWFLSKNWKKIKKIAKNKSFGLVIKVKGGKDESAEIVFSKVKK